MRCGEWNVAEAINDAAGGLRAAMLAAGLDCAGPMVADGKLHRFKAGGDTERNSWFVLYSDPPQPLTPPHSHHTFTTK